MYTKSQNKKSLNDLRLKIGEIGKIIDKHTLYIIPNQGYNELQNKAKKEVIKCINELEHDISKSMEFQDESYLFFCNLEKKSVFIKAENDILELFLNTDPSLIEKDIPLRDKINTARQILAEKIEYTKKAFFDIYYIYEVIKTEGRRIGWNNDKRIDNFFDHIVNKYFNINQSYATSYEYYLLKKISDEDNFDVAFDIYYKNLDKLFDVTFIKVNSGEKGTFIPVDLYKPFKTIENVSKNLYSPFYGGKVNFISGMVTQRTKSRTYTQRNISLDSNTVSFIRTLVEGRQNNLPKQMINAIVDVKKITNEPIFFDFGPYILENYTFDKTTKNKIFETLTTVEKYFYPNNEEYRIKNLNNLSKILTMDTFHEKVKEEYCIGYALLLSLCLIHFKCYKLKPLEKLESFCLYMDQRLFVLREPFIEVAYNFYTKSNQYKFFKKIQKNAKNIIKDLKNMAWDVFHLWMLETECSSVDDGYDLLVPYFYCFDGGLLELKECFDLETIFVNKKTNERICFYHKHSYPLELLEQYKTIEKERIRRRHFNHENISSQIEYLEKEIDSLW